MNDGMMNEGNKLIIISLSMPTHTHQVHTFSYVAYREISQY